MSSAEFAQEYMADFNTYAGQIWAFDYEKCVADLSELDTSKMGRYSRIRRRVQRPNSTMCACIRLGLRKLLCD